MFTPEGNGIIAPAGVASLIFARHPWFATLAVSQQASPNLYLGQATLNDAALARVALPLTRSDLLFVTGFAGSDLRPHRRQPGDAGPRVRPAHGGRRPQRASAVAAARGGAAVHHRRSEWGHDRGEHGAGLFPADVDVERDRRVHVGQGDAADFRGPASEGPCAARPCRGGARRGGAGAGGVVVGGRVRRRAAAAHRAAPAHRAVGGGAYHAEGSARDERQRDRQRGGPVRKGAGVRRHAERLPGPGLGHERQRLRAGLSGDRRQGAGGTRRGAVARAARGRQRDR